MSMTEKEKADLEAAVKVSTDRNDNFLKNCRTANKISNYLSNLSASFYDIGNEKLADKLFLMSDELNEAIKNLDKAFREESHERYKDTMQSTSNLVQAALAGILIASKPNNEKMGND